MMMILCIGDLSSVLLFYFFDFVLDLVIDLRLKSVYLSNSDYFGFMNFLFVLFAYFWDLFENGLFSNVLLSYTEQWLLSVFLDKICQTELRLIPGCTIVTHAARYNC